MDHIGIIVFVILICLTCTILKELKSSYAVLCSFCGALLILFFSLDEISEIRVFITDLQKCAGIPAEYGAIIFKVLGVCVLGNLAMGLCHDCKYSTLADSLEILCKCVTLGLALPIFKDVITIIGELLS